MSPELSGGELGSKKCKLEPWRSYVTFWPLPLPPPQQGTSRFKTPEKANSEWIDPPQKMQVASVKVFCCCVYLPFPALFALRTQISKSSQFLPPTPSKCYLHVVRCFWENVSCIFEGVQKDKIVSYIFSRPPSKGLGTGDIVHSFVHHHLYRGFPLVSSWHVNCSTHHGTSRERWIAGSLRQGVALRLAIIEPYYNIISMISKRHVSSF